MKILAIDPGPTESAWLIFDTKTGRIDSFRKSDNADILISLHAQIVPLADVMVIEKVASFGMPVGAEVFETVFWSGRFAERWGNRFDRLTRIQIKNHLCHTSRAKDANIRQALIDRFGPPGTKKNPGITYGISKDLWSALAVAVTYADLNDGKQKLF